MDSHARGYSVPKSGEVFGMGVRTPTPRNDPAPTNQRDCATGRCRPSPVVQCARERTYASGHRL